MSPSLPTPEEFDALRGAALAPLRFACRHHFANLGRIAHLQATLSRSLERLAAALPGEHAAAREIRALAGQIPRDDHPRAAREAALHLLLQRLERLAPPSAPPGPPEAPAALPPVAPAPEERAPATRLPPADPGASTPVPPAGAPAAAAGPPRARPASPAPPLTADSPLSQVPGVGPRVAAQLATRELATVEDLLRFLPRRFRSREGTAPISQLQKDTLATVEGTVQAVRDRFVRGRRVLEVMLNDGSGMLMLTWFRAPGRSFAEQFAKGARFVASGTVRRHRAWWQMAHPEVRRIEDLGTLPFEAEPAAAGAADGAEWEEGAVVPLYLDIDGLHPNALRKLIDRVLRQVSPWADPLPAGLRQRRGLCGLDAALRALHQPPADAEPEALEARRDLWHRRLIYEELLFLQLGLALQRAHGSARERAVRLAPSAAPLPRFAEAHLPFAPTGAQARVLAELDADLRLGRPMQRLLQGDVGSGKTAVAWAAAMAMVEAGQQVALMAPTELLAEQHARSVARMTAPLYADKTALLTGSTPAKERRALFERLHGGEPMLVVGTHALIAQRVSLPRLGLAIVDEQHRFGVMQRTRLKEIGLAGQGLTPHLLAMTATPIPRTLAMTVYGELDVSVLDELPPGRKPIRTSLVTDRDRTRAYARVRQQIEAGRQAYVVFPLVEASDKEGMEDIRAATESADELAQGPLRGLRLALLHGRVSVEQKEEIMRRFVAHDIDVLVATTVVEVGIDVPNATTIVIEHAERFGLSQLHQLRGRVGRGTHDSECLLLARAKASMTAARRLHVLVESNDGFRIAEEDLALRGPGDFVGTRQSGLPMLTLADLTRDSALLADARADAKQLVAADPRLERPEHRPCAARLEKVWRKGGESLASW